MSGLLETPAPKPRGGQHYAYVVVDKRDEHIVDVALSRAGARATIDAMVGETERKFMRVRRAKLTLFER